MDSSESIFHLSAVERFGKELLAGGLAGAAGKSSVAPLERVKILIQTEKSSSARLSDVLRYMYKADGVQGLFRGNGAAVLRIVPYAALHFSTYEHYRAAFVATLHKHSIDSTKAQARPPVWIDLLAGSASGATAVVFTYPLDLVRTRMAWEVETKHLTGATIQGTIKRILKQEGIQGLYRGATPTLLGILPYSGIKFFVYQKFKRAWSDAQASGSEAGRRKPPVYFNLLFGATAGLVAQTVTYPLDVIRRRMQVSAVAKGPEGEVASMSQTTRAIIAQHGWGGLFRGVYLNYIKIAPATAIGFTVYDLMKDLLGLENHL